MKKILLGILLVTLLLGIAFISFVLNETKDEINATTNTVEEKLNSLVNVEKFAGFSVSVFNADSIFYMNGFGYADVEEQTPYSIHTQQYVASISKTAIGIALLKAQELELLDIDAPINNYLPFEINNPNFPDIAITLRHLATHTSSLDYNEEVVESLYIEEAQKEESLERFMLAYFRDGEYGDITFGNYAPGSQWNYSNIGGGLAAYIIEKQSGLSFTNFSQKYIFDPLEITSAFWFEGRSDSVRHSRYYEANETSIKEVKTSGVQLYPSRDLITDVRGLTTYCQAIIARDSRLLTPKSFETLLSTNLADEVVNTHVDNSGLFIMIDRNQYGITYQLTGMNGGDNCINAMMWFDPKTEMGYIFIGNTGSSQLNRGRLIWIYRTLVSLGDHILLSNPENSIVDNATLKWHNYYSRVAGLF
ncbi:MAG: serine hydrolase domain-containing protein [Calditrichia bacterium]